MLKNVIIDEEIRYNEIRKGNLRGPPISSQNKERDIIIFNAKEELQHGGYIIAFILNYTNCNEY